MPSGACSKSSVATRSRCRRLAVPSVSAGINVWPRPPCVDSRCDEGDHSSIKTGAPAQVGGWGRAVVWSRTFRARTAGMTVQMRWAALNAMLAAMRHVVPVGRTSVSVQTPDSRYTLSEKNGLWPQSRYWASSRRARSYRSDFIGYNSRSTIDPSSITWSSAPLQQVRITQATHLVPDVTRHNSWS